MTRRLLYHFFWNFYDYLGRYLLLGTASVAGLLTILLAGGFVAALTPSTALKSLISAITLLLLLGCGIWFASGTFAFATRGARQEPARLPDFLAGARSLFRSYLKLILTGCITLAVCVSNIWFYQRMAANPGTDPAMRTVLIVASVTFLWILLGLLLYLFCTSAVPARFPDEAGLRPVLRRGALLMALAPGMWIIAAVLYLLIAVVCFLSLIGAIFLLPLLSVLTTTALDISLRLVEDLQTARAQLGDGRSVREYKKRGLELGWEWEYRQPRRTLRELIRPWE